MKSYGLGGGLAMGLLLTGCGSATPAAATRVLGPDAALLSTLPVCFEPPSVNSSLTEQAVQRGTIEICTEAARSQGVVVVPWENNRCLAATLAWASRDTTKREAECGGITGMNGVQCESTGVLIKSLKVVLSPASAASAAHAAPVAESTATINSTYDHFSRESYRSLCAAAFHDYPKSLSNVQFDVPVE